MVLGVNQVLKATQQEQLFEKSSCHIFSAKDSTLQNNNEASKQTLNMAPKL
jgi:hypothetical protein